MVKIFINLLKKRRSIRVYKENKIEDAKINYILKSALLSPSSRSIQPWEFIVVKDEETINKLSRSKINGSDFIKASPLVIAVIADTNKSDVTVEDASIASVIIQLAAEELELGSCWIQIRKRVSKNNKSSEQYVREILEIPENYLVESLISIGYKAEELPEYNEEELPLDKIHLEKF